MHALLLRPPDRKVACIHTSNKTEVRWSLTAMSAVAVTSTKSFIRFPAARYNQLYFTLGARKGLSPGAGGPINLASTIPQGIIIK